MKLCRNSRYSNWQFWCENSVTVYCLRIDIDEDRITLQLSVESYHFVTAYQNVWH